MKPGLLPLDTQDSERIFSDHDRYIDMECIHMVEAVKPDQNYDQKRKLSQRDKLRLNLFKKRCNLIKKLLGRQSWVNEARMYEIVLRDAFKGICPSTSDC